jgi:type IV pilus assembly protein PilQ
MKSALRLMLLATFAALGIGFAICVALRLEPELSRDADVASIGPAPSIAARTAKDESLRRAASEEASVPGPAWVDEAARPAHPSPAPADAPSQVTMAHQMGRLEEKLRRAEEFAERQQKSWETMLTEFQEREQAPARSAVLHRQEETPEGRFGPLRGEVEGELSPADAVVHPLPAPVSGAIPQIVPQEDAGRLTLNLRNSDLRQVLELLGDQHGMNIVASRTVQGTVTAKLTDVDVHAALDAVLKATGFVARREGNIIYVAAPEEFLAFDHARDHVGTRIYRPNYITAIEMQNLLTPLMTPGVGVVSVSSAARVGIPSDSVEAGGDSFSGSDVVLVQDYETVLKRIDQLLLEVDVRPLQVAIEALIITVSLDDRNVMGVNFALLRDNAVLVSGAPAKDLATVAFDGGLKFGFLDSSLGVFIQALENIGDTNVVAAPRVMVLNKQRAEVLIGEKLGYATTTTTETATTQAVEFLEVGTQLRIRPFISSDGMIRLEVHPKLSTGFIDTSGLIPLPNEVTTQVTTNIMCPDGATVVIGGLIREDLTSNSTQIPVLGALPWIGWAFRQRTETLARTETLVLLTPRIVSAPVAAAEGAQGKSEYLRRQDWRFDKMNPLAQRYYGKQYLRKALAAWNAGDPSAALRYANLAIHFDPENREAMNLRAEIVETSGYGDRSVETHLREGLTPWAHPLREYSRHGAPWQIPEQPPLIDASPPDPGVPGKIRELPAPPPYQQYSPAFPLGLPPTPWEEVPGVEVRDDTQ